MLEYPNDELELKRQIEQLNIEWLNNIVANDNSSNKAELRDLYVSDGFYPYYTHQPVKVLFIGKESLEIGGQDYIEILFRAYRNNRVGEHSLNKDQFHSTMLYLAYALKHKIYNWHDLPYASEFTNDFGKSDGCSFAFMNISKFSNESGNWQADEELIDTFLRLSIHPSIDFFNREIDILNPDIIIGMNLGERMKWLGSYSNPQYYGSNDDVCYQTLTTSTNKKYIYIDAWHFSAPRKSPERDIFNPIIEALQDNNII